MVDRYLKPTAPYIVLLLSPGPVTVVRKVYAKGKDKPQTTRMTFRNDRAIYIPAAEPGTEATIESLSDGIITFGKIWPPDCN
jgi:hypothetical protein